MTPKRTVNRRRSLTLAYADSFGKTLHAQLCKVVAHHLSNVAEFALETQMRIERAEDLLRQVAACSRADPNRKHPAKCPTKGKWRTVNVPAAVMDEIDALLASANARNDDGHNT